MEKVIVANIQDLRALFEAFGIEESPEEFMITANEWGLVEDRSDSAPEKFARLYLAYRRSMKHKNVTLIRPGNNQWKVLKDVTREAIAFCTENDLEEDEGFRLFLDVAGQVTNSMKLHEIRAKSDKIHEHFVAVEIVRSDPNKQLTQQVWDSMASHYVSSTGRDYPVKYVPLQVQYFVEAAALCKKYKIRPKAFVEMLVNEFAWLGFPKPYHLVGDKAKELCKQGYIDRYGAPKVKRVSLKHIKDIRDD